MPKEPTKTPRKRGRPEMTASQKARMKKNISKTAQALFQDEGYAKVSMRKIAKEIGCTPMSLYRYYDSKIDILRSLWSDVLADLFSALETLPSSENAHHRLRNLGVGYVTYWIDKPEHYRLVFMAEGVTQPHVSLFVDNPDIIAKYDIFLDAILSLDGDGIPSEATKHKLDFFLSTLHGIAQNHITISGYPWSAPEKQIEYAVRALSGNSP
ncbi:MAG: TetR/AcrR family transcriptional regulator [Litorimonas sp.]